MTQAPARRREWRLRGLTGEVLVVARGDVGPDERARVVPWHRLERDFARWLDDPALRPLVHEMAGRFGGPIANAHASRGRELVRRALARRFGDGVLVALAVPGAHIGALPLPVEDTPPPPRLGPHDDTDQKTWISIRLVDTDGEPVKQRRYRLTLPNGDVREGTTDARGSAYFGDIDAGACTLEWPGTDGSDWAPA